jgi:hypothetical protein
VAVAIRESVGDKQLPDDTLLADMPYPSWTVAFDLYTGEAAKLEIDGENSSSCRRLDVRLSDHRLLFEM